MVLLSQGTFLNTGPRGEPLPIQLDAADDSPQLTNALACCRRPILSGRHEDDRLKISVDRAQFVEHLLRTVIERCCAGVERRLQTFDAHPALFELVKHAHDVV